MLCNFGSFRIATEAELTRIYVCPYTCFGVRLVWRFLLPFFPKISEEALGSVNAAVCWNNSSTYNW